MTRALIIWLFPLSALAQADKAITDRFDELLKRHEADISKFVSSLNARLESLQRTPRELSTNAIDLRGNATSAELLAAAVSITGSGTEAGVSVDLIGLRYGEAQPTSLVLALASLKDNESRFGAAWSYRWRDDIATGKYCKVKTPDVSNSAKAAYKAAFVQICRLVETTHLPADASDQAKKAHRQAHVACEPSDAERDEVTTLQGAYAVFSVWKRRVAANDPDLAQAIATLQKTTLFTKCDETAAARKYAKLAFDTSKFTLSFGASVDFFPWLSGFDKEARTLERQGESPGERNRMKGQTVLAEGRYARRDFQFAFGSSANRTVESVYGSDARWNLGSTAAFDWTVLSLSGGSVSELRPGEPRVTLGLDLSTMFDVTGSGPSVGGRFLGGTVRPRVDTTVTDKIKVRIAIPITARKEVLPANADGSMGAESGVSWTVPATVATVFNF